MKRQKKGRNRKKAGHRSWAAGNQPVAGGHRGDIMSAEKRNALMARIGSRNTRPEILVSEELERRGLVFETHAGDLAGRPDVVFREALLAIFIDGDFWHGWRFPLWEAKLSRRWKEKISKTRERDQRNFRRLRREGWHVLRIWEHQIEQDLTRCIERVLARLGGGPDEVGE